MAVDLKKAVKNRRKLRFENTAHALAEAERLVNLLGDRNDSAPQANPDGSPVVHSGNMTLSQNLGHMAIINRMPVDGYLLQPNWIMKIVGKLMKNSILNSGFTMTYKNPDAVDEKIVPPPGTPAKDAFTELKASIEYFENTPEYIANPAFGPLTDEEWTKLVLRHMEWHLGFMHENKP